MKMVLLHQKPKKSNSKQYGLIGKVARRVHKKLNSRLDEVVDTRVIEGLLVLSTMELIGKCSICLLKTPVPCIRISMYKAFIAR